MNSTPGLGMQRRRARTPLKAAAMWAAGLVVVVLSLGIPPPAAATVARDDERALAERFAPVMMLVSHEEPCGSGEPYRPSAVDPLFDNDGIALRGPWAADNLAAVAPGVEELSRGLRGYSLDLPGNPLRPGCDYEEWARELWKSSEPTIYARVATQHGRDDRLALQYFFFYPFNDYNNKHEGDWERIQLEFAAGDAAEALGELPVDVVYAQHYGSESAQWGGGKLEVVGQTHPVVYVSAGSHASQYRAGLFLGNSASTGFGCDTTVGPHERIVPLVRTIPSDPDVAARQFPWTTFEGHWGELGPRRFYEGPTGPNMKQAWSEPFTWSDGARSSSFPVPGANAVGTTGTEFFCDVVGGGSNLFRNLVNDPVPVLGLLFGALVVVVWSIRRTSWRSEPFPVAGRRGPGAVVTAAFSVARRYPWLFARLSLLPALLLVLAVVLQTYTASSHAVPLLLRVLVVSAAWALLVLFTGAVVQALASLDENPDVPPSRLFRAHARLHLRALVSVALASVVLVLLGTTVVLLPLAILVLVSMGILIPVVHMEQSWGLAAFRRSVRLAWLAIGTVAPLFILGLLVSLILGLLLAAVVFIVFTAPFVVVNAVPPVVFAIVWPFITLVSTYAYFDAAARERAR